MEQYPDAQEQPELCLRVGEMVMVLTFGNTLINLFGNTMLNHTQWQDQTQTYAIYNDTLLDRLYELGFPQYSRSDEPEWAVQRLINSGNNEEQDIEIE